ncbi:MAG: NifB/NifX family molybdenum-iron cluster-binding protein [Spirochaetota bacterium]
MRVAISSDKGKVSAHFGRCPYFTIADVEGGRITAKRTVANPGHQPGAIPEFLQKEGVGCIIAGGMGRRAQELFKSAGINAVLGVTGSVEEVLKRFAEGKLEGGTSLCRPGSGKGYGMDKAECDHP